MYDFNLNSTLITGWQPLKSQAPASKLPKITKLSQFSTKCCIVHYSNVLSRGGGSLPFPLGATNARYATGNSLIFRQWPLEFGSAVCWSEMVNIAPAETDH